MPRLSGWKNPVFSGSLGLLPGFSVVSGLRGSRRPSWVLILFSGFLKKCLSRDFFLAFRKSMLKPVYSGDTCH
jgi:hypothetical protein